MSEKLPSNPDSDINGEKHWTSAPSLRPDHQPLTKFACNKPLYTCSMCRDIMQILAMGESMTKAEIADYLGNEISEMLLDFHLNGLVLKGHVKQEGQEYQLARDHYIEETIMRIAAEKNNRPKTKEEFVNDKRLAGIPEREIVVAMERLRVNNCLVLYWQDEDHTTSSLRAYLKRVKQMEGKEVAEPKEMYKLGLRGASILNVCGICANPIEDGPAIVETIHEEVNPEGDAYVVAFHPQCYASHLDPGKSNGVGFCHYCGLPLSIKLLERMFWEENIGEDGELWVNDEIGRLSLEMKRELFISAVKKLYDPASILLYINRKTVFKQGIGETSYLDEEEEPDEDALTAEDIDLDWINGAALVVKNGGWYYHPTCWKKLKKEEEEKRKCPERKE